MELYSLNSVAWLVESLGQIFEAAITKLVQWLLVAKLGFLVSGASNHNDRP